MILKILSFQTSTAGITEEREGTEDELSFVLDAQFEVKTSERYTGCFFTGTGPAPKV